MATTFSNTIFDIGHWGIVGRSGATITVQFVATDQAILDGTVTQVGDTVLLNGAVTLTATDLDDPAVMVFSAEGGVFFVFATGPITLSQEYTFANSTFDSAFVVPCFVAGTRILTRRGEVAVEDLQVGDEAKALIGRGFVPITWIGKRHVHCAATTRPADHWPLRVRAGAFGPNRPHRDLLLSPDHAVYVDGYLIPIRYLETGVTVVREPMAEVTYYHVELEQHGVLVAEGMPAESYLDTGNRADFEGAARDPDRAEADEIKARRIWAQEGCAPIHTSGKMVDQVRHRLEVRAAALGFTEVIDPELRLVVGDKTIAPTRLGDAWQFTLPEQTAGARLVSIAHVPAVCADHSGDRRCLGVPVSRMLIDNHPVALDAPFLRHGWHLAEEKLRWTNGMAHLPPLRTLTLVLAPITPRIAAPDRADTARTSAA